jgi:hypothetical protein
LTSASLRLRDIGTHASAVRPSGIVDNCGYGRVHAKMQGGQNTATSVRVGLMSRTEPVTLELTDEQRETLAARLDDAIRKGRDIDLPSEGSTMLSYRIRRKLVDALIADWGIMGPKMAAELALAIRAIGLSGSWAFELGNGLQGPSTSLFGANRASVGVWPPAEVIDRRVGAKGKYVPRARTGLVARKDEFPPSVSAALCEEFMPVTRAGICYRARQPACQKIPCS